MLTVISPAKKLHDAPKGRAESAPAFADDTAELLDAMGALGVQDLMTLMSISEKLARLNHDRFRDWDAAPETAAIHTFAGDTYTGLDAATLDADAIRQGQDRLRILSGLYGLLRPLDAMRPYRLEMGSKLKTARGDDLYDFWDRKLADALNAAAEAAGAAYLLNCASREYFSAVDPVALELPVITPTFLEDKPGGPKQVSFFAKQARGAMARWVIENRIEEPEDLRGFDTGGYEWQREMSAAENPVFLRADTAQKAA
ncbi:peroxide stress protein YaaA [Jannaschia ovalis]|uniref:UPF0246 protein P8627_10290 n=1 Tax=Jannaschia ovalis TaxID=3038773 RepID=A0ABY8L7T6_9RHOB|nr:peroxide stress protein YaaA [Jannaschia sp. GRR-S6-38]WGH77437.1 peroxide stress protein YaaA [Jannaschia sp. GRR-S6-38]